MGRKPVKHACGPPVKATCGVAIVTFSEVPTRVVQATVNEKKRFQWEDKASGDYFSESSGVSSDGNQFYRYHNVTVGNKSDGYSKRYFVEEKFQKPAQSSYKGSKKSFKALKYYD